MELFSSLPLILDGATGTSLQKRGMPSGVCPEKWILENPEILVALQRDYAAAGSDILTTATFGANSAALERNGIAGQTAEYNKKLTALSAEASGGKALLAGDISPTGLQMAPYGSTTLDEVVAVYAEQVRALDEAGVDFFLIETSIALCEARAAILAVKENSKKPFAVSFSVGANGSSLYGSDIVSALVTAQALGASAFGINCCGDLKLLTELMKRLSPFAKIPLLVQPNAGLPEMIDGVAHYSLTPDELADFARELPSFGVGIFGGCCGTAPEHIAALKKALGGAVVAEPAGTGKLLFASEKNALAYSPELENAEVVCSEDILEDAEDAADEADFIRLSIPDEDALEAFLENSAMLRLPLCVSSPSVEILEKAVRAYSGTLLCDMPKTPLLEALHEKYGLELI